MIDMYTPENDITREQADGTVVQLAAKGVPIPMAEARARGFVKDAQQTGPSETKAEPRAEEAPAVATGGEEADAPKRAGRK